MKNSDNKTIHDTEKPVELTRILIENSSNENDTIFDPFMGIGGCAVATKLCNRKFIGVELDKYYFNVCKERIIDSYIKL